MLIYESWEYSVFPLKKPEGDTLIGYVLAYPERAFRLCLFAILGGVLMLFGRHKRDNS